MTLSMHLRRRMAVGLAGALLGATLLGGAAQVSADESGTNPIDQRDVAAERDRNVGRDIVVDNGATMAPGTGEVQQAPSASDDSWVLPVSVINLSQSPDDRS